MTVTHTYSSSSLIPLPRSQSQLRLFRLEDPTDVDYVRERRVDGSGRLPETSLLNKKDGLFSLKLLHGNDISGLDIVLELLDLVLESIR